MVRFANPAAGQRKITRAFIAASAVSESEEEESYVDANRLAPALALYGFTLKDRPADFVHEDKVEVGSSGMDESGAATNSKPILSNALKQLGQMSLMFRSMALDANAESITEEELEKLSGS